MAEYIEREAVKKVIDNVYSDLYPEYVSNSIAAFRECIIVDVGIIPAADVQPVKHGYWEEVTDYVCWEEAPFYRCSVCGEEWYLEAGNPKENNMNFCPRCGARMDGDANE